jgi:hypothetical protein
MSSSLVVAQETITVTLTVTDLKPSVYLPALTK